MHVIDLDPVDDLHVLGHDRRRPPSGVEETRALMGVLVYGHGEARVRIDDPTLAHVKTIALMKLRRNESFALTVRQDASDHGRTTLWMHPAIALQFSFDSDDLGEVDRALLEELMHEANTGEIVVRTAADDSAASARG